MIDDEGREHIVQFAPDEWWLGDGMTPETLSRLRRRPARPRQTAERTPRRTR